MSLVLTPKNRRPQEYSKTLGWITRFDLPSSISLHCVIAMIAGLSLIQDAIISPLFHDQARENKAVDAAMIMTMT